VTLINEFEPAYASHSNLTSGLGN